MLALSPCSARSSCSAPRRAAPGAGREALLACEVARQPHRQPLQCLMCALGGGILATERQRMRAGSNGCTGDLARARSVRMQAAEKGLDRRSKDEDEDLWNDIRNPPPGQINSFVPGATLEDAKMFAATRTIAVAPWSEDVTPKPIFAVSDNTGQVAKMIAEMGFRQFGDVQNAMVDVIPAVQTEEDVKRAVEQAANYAPEESLAIEQAGAMIIFSLSTQLGNFLVSECGRQGVPCINAMGSVVQGIEACLKVERGSTEPPAKPRKTFYAVSDASAEVVYLMLCKALDQFPESCVGSITVCSDVRMLQEVDHIVDAAAQDGSLVVYALASPGMSRFLRQQCERAKIPYADVFQPVVIALERYFDYPPVGVPGGHYSKTDVLSAKSLETGWQQKPVTY
ncbi:PDRP1 [Symbiodinium natans]|uniref:PDRP1 protein n=1 Tax=Symbiodinium natans TaxID=878477 RepID=A0A812N8U1_9DINO|nr:PDRP1 [Symbiodinium natans]